MWTTVCLCSGNLIVPIREVLMITTRVTREVATRLSTMSQGIDCPRRVRGLLILDPLDGVQQRR